MKAPWYLAPWRGLKRIPAGLRGIERWLTDYFGRSDPTLAYALAPLILLSVVLFVRHPATNYIFDEQEALLANPYVNATEGLKYLDAIYRDFWGLPPDASIAPTARSPISSGAPPGGSASTPSSTTSTTSSSTASTGAPRGLRLRRQQAARRRLAQRRRLRVERGAHRGGERHRRIADVLGAWARCWRSRLCACPRRPWGSACSRRSPSASSARRARWCACRSCRRRPCSPRRRCTRKARPLGADGDRARGRPRGLRPLRGAPARVVPFALAGGAVPAAPEGTGSSACSTTISWSGFGRRPCPRIR